ncbi:DUF4919 domain-containing protein [Chryseobacterium nematophagum]|uniref:DUF4919 domain-containing protein n=1 Tax=Chryseobacterium nematophagum TaxID=2305228 RepID=A0A3M7TFE7_9FLAO|nr:DUF4919 domain-containing protein [Chryseobacterium nematophagum]RNA60930.1 DUF4919 domain-containing protein [Chryseobacterium nematophagum]
MKYYFFLLLIVTPIFGFSQKSKLDFNSIEKNLNDTESSYNYEKIIFKYKGFPKSLDSIEAEHLYYGRNFSDSIISTSDEDFKTLAHAFKDNNFEDCIRLGKILYNKDPTNLDVLLILLRAYDTKHDENNFIHHLVQFRTLTDAIKSSGDGKSEKTAYLVNTIGDEYILLNILNIGSDYKRQNSSPTKNGMFDVWEKDKNTVLYIKVLYLNL